METELPYIVFIAPALLAITMMYNSFFENTYASFVRMYYQKTFDAMMATPLSLEDIIAGEIVWGATKSVIASAIMLARDKRFRTGPLSSCPAHPAAVFSGRAGFRSRRDGFHRPGAKHRHVQPSDFPLYNPHVSIRRDLFPELHPSRVGSKDFPTALPLTHLVDFCRAFCLGEMTDESHLGCLYLAIFFVLLFPLALIVMRRRLIN